MALRDAEAAAVAFGKAIDLSPNDPTPHFNRGVALRAGGRNEAAIADFDRALALVPDNPIAICLRGRSALALGQIEKAHQDFVKASAIDSTLEELPGDLAYTTAFQCDWTHFEADDERDPRCRSRGPSRVLPVRRVAAAR